jgi:hypothetical protein
LRIFRRTGWSKGTGEALFGFATAPGGHFWLGRPAALGHQSGLRPANFTTLAHFAVSSASNLPYAAGGPISTDEPKSANFAPSLGSASPALISLLSLSTISAGVSLGAPMPLEELAS